MNKRKVHKLLRDIATQNPITYSDDAPLPYKQLAALVNDYQTQAREILAADKKKGGAAC